MDVCEVTAAWACCWPDHPLHVTRTVTHTQPLNNRSRHLILLYTPRPPVECSLSLSPSLSRSSSPGEEPVEARRRGGEPQLGSDCAPGTSPRQLEGPRGQGGACGCHPRRPQRGAGSAGGQLQQLCAAARQPDAAQWGAPAARRGTEARARTAAASRCGM